jgi:hypothetical protein
MDPLPHRLDETAAVTLFSCDGDENLQLARVPRTVRAFEALPPAHPRSIVESWWVIR